MSTTPLLPCPCCGGPAHFVQTECGGYVVECAEKHCVASGFIQYACGDEPHPLMAATWNNRVALGQLEVLRKVEQMAAYYEAPKGFFDWVDHQLAKLGAAPNTVEPKTIQQLPSNMLDAINQRMNGGRCPNAGSLGECAAIDQVAPGIYEAYLYIWDHEFNDSAAMASWFHEAGAKTCTVSLTLYSDYNGDRNGQTEEGSREWVVTFSMRQACSTGSPEGLLTREQEGGA